MILIRKVILGFFLLFCGCGYFLKAIKNTDYKTVFIPAFVNKIAIQEDSPAYRLYYPGLEIELENILKERFRYDGNIRPVSEVEYADIIIQGVILYYDKEALRYASNENVEEYRIIVRTEIRLMQKDTEIWKETIAGESTYLISGPNAKTEVQAVRAALEDLSRKIVERIVEDW